MNIFRALLNKITKGSDPGSTGNTYWPRQSTAGIRVTNENALTYSAIWRAVMLISQGIAVLPWTVNQRDSDRKTKIMYTHPAATLLDLQPNPETDALTFRQTLVAWALTWGNGYGEIVKDRANRPVEIWQISPDRVRPDRDNSGKLIYEITNGTTANTILRPDQMFHLKGPGFDGLTGYSVIAHAAKTIGLGLATEEFGSNFFANGANAGGVLQHPGPQALSDTALKHLKESIVEGVGGRNSNSPMILEEGMTWESISIPPDDAQFLETRKFGVAEVARWYGIPLHKLNEMDKSSFNNIEQQNIEFVTDGLLIWVRRLEMEANLKLVSQANRGRVYTKLNLNALLRGDTKSRGEWYKNQTTIGAMNVNEVRELEDANPIGPDGDKYLVQMNLTTLDKVGETSEPIQGPVPVETDDEEDEQTEDESQAAQTILVENAERITTRLKHRAAEALKNYDGDRDGLVRYLAKFSDDQRDYMHKQLTTPVQAFGLKLDLDQFIDTELEAQCVAILASFDTGEQLFHVEPTIMVTQMMEATHG